MEGGRGRDAAAPVTGRNETYVSARCVSSGGGGTCAAGKGERCRATQNYTRWDVAKVPHGLPPGLAYSEVAIDSTGVDVGH